MAQRTLKVTRIGNSRGVRLPATSLRRYQIGESVLMEERSDGILLKPAGSGIDKLTWEATAREMDASNEDWTEWNVVDDDGLATAPWKPEKPRRGRGGKHGQPRRRR